jgi:undecaprenyl-diphosphatase
MSVWDAVVLGIVQGATEFLPVSSSGHLVIAETLLHVRSPGILLEVVVHVGTLVSVLVVYWSRMTELAVGVVRWEAEAVRYAGKLLVASIPAGLVGVFAARPIEALFDNPLVPGVGLLVTGGVLWSSRGVSRSAGASRPGWTAALLIGLAQAFAIVPGISRSGSTVVAAMWLGVEAREAAAFSFLMAVIAIAGAAVLQLPQAQGVATGAVEALVVGGLVSAVTGVLAIRGFLAMLSHRSFHLFAPYCWAIGAGFIAYLLLA